MAEILLPNTGGVTLVDDSDAAWLNQWRWRESHDGYAVRTGVHAGSPRYSIRMHRAILCAPTTLTVDHINGDRLDNRRANLRLTTPAENNQNRRGAQRGSKTGVRGVELHQSGLYKAIVVVGGKRHYLGYFKSLREADLAVRAGRARLHTHSAESDGRDPVTDPMNEAAR